MRKPTGNHHARRAAVKGEPSPITALRDMLAGAFASDIGAVTSEVCAILQTQVQLEGNAERRAILRSALVALARGTQELTDAVAAEFRSRFDARLKNDGAFSSSSYLSIDDPAAIDESTRELDLALDQCAARLREQCSAQLFQLSARFCDMLGEVSLADARNPLLPRVFASSLAAAIAKLCPGSEMKLAAFKAFAPALLHIAPDVYRHADELLAELKPPAPAAQALPDEKSPATLLERLLDGARAIPYMEAARQ